MIELNADGSITLAEFPVWDGNGGFAFEAVKIRYPRGRHYRAARNHADKIMNRTAELGREIRDNRDNQTRIIELNSEVQDYLDQAVPHWLGELLRNCSDATIPPDDRADDWREEFPPYAYEFRFTQTILRHWRSSPFGSG
jgi:hypothetical protein